MRFKILKLDEQNRVVVEVETKFGKDTWCLNLAHTKTVEEIVDGESIEKEVPLEPADYEAMINAEIDNFESETEALQKAKAETPLGIEAMLGKEF